MVCRGGQSPSSPKGSMWQAAQYINYGSGQHACMPQVILFLWKLIPGKKLLEACYIPNRGHLGGCQESPTAEEAYTQRKLTTLMGVSKTTVHHWIVGLTIHVHCNSLKPVLTEENKVARLLMALHFRDPVDQTKYHDMLDQIHLDKKLVIFPHPEEEEVSPSPRGENPKCCIKH